MQAPSWLPPLPPTCFYPDAEAEGASQMLKEELVVAQKRNATLLDELQVASARQREWQASCRARDELRREVEQQRQLLDEVRAQVLELQQQNELLAQEARTERLRAMDAIENQLKQATESDRLALQVRASQGSEAERRELREELSALRLRLDLAERSAVDNGRYIAQIRRLEEDLQLARSFEARARETEAELTRATAERDTLEATRRRLLEENSDLKELRWRSDQQVEELRADLEGSARDREKLLSDLEHRYAAGKSSRWSSGGDAWGGERPAAPREGALSRDASYRSGGSLRKPGDEPPDRRDIAVVRGSALVSEPLQMPMPRSPGGARGTHPGREQALYDLT